MKFSDLAPGDTFEFDHATLRGGCGSLVHGPWKKRTAHTYLYADHRSVQHFRVGAPSIRVRPVAPGTTGGCRPQEPR